MCHCTGTEQNMPTDAAENYGTAGGSGQWGGDKWVLVIVPLWFLFPLAYFHLCPATLEIIICMHLLTSHVLLGKMSYASHFLNKWFGIWPTKMSCVYSATFRNAQACMWLLNRAGCEAGLWVCCWHWKRYLTWVFMNEADKVEHWRWLSWLCSEVSFTSEGDWSQLHCWRCLVDFHHGN